MRTRVNKWSTGWWRALRWRRASGWPCSITPGPGLSVGNKETAVATAIWRTFLLEARRDKMTYVSSLVLCEPDGSNCLWELYQMLCHLAAMVTLISVIKGKPRHSPDSEGGEERGQESGGSQTWWSSTLIEFLPLFFFFPFKLELDQWTETLQWNV